MEKPFFELSSEVLSKIENNIINVDLETAYGVKRGKNNRQKYQSNTIELMQQKATMKPESKNCNC